MHSARGESKSEREREEFVALKYGVLCVPRCTSPIKSWGGREVRSAARAQHILAKRELYFSTFSCFQLYNIWDPERWGCGAAFCSNTLRTAENSYVFTHTHWMLLWRQSAVFIAYGIIACRTSAPFLCIKYRWIYYTAIARARAEAICDAAWNFLLAEHPGALSILHLTVRNRLAYLAGRR